MTGIGDYSRYAVYYTPVRELAAFGAAWFGWDPATGDSPPHPVAEAPGIDLPRITEAPRRYGFHATMKAPFRLAQGVEAAALPDALARFCAAEDAVTLEAGLALTRLEGFLALTPAGQSAALSSLEMRLVEALDPFRAPLTPAEVARRDPGRLSPRQRHMLERWGYPYVGEEFRFHMTLTGRLSDAEAASVEAILRPRLAPLLPMPFVIDALSLLGEDAGGRFHLLRRFALRVPESSHLRRLASHQMTPADSSISPKAIG